MSGVNKAIIVGRLGADPDVQTLPDGETKVAKMSVATSERYKDRSGEMVEKTEWHRMVAWRKKAEFAEKYLRKGVAYAFEGKLQTRKWQDSEGHDRYTTEINVENIQFVEGKASQQASAGQAQQAPQQRQQAQAQPKQESFDDDVPF